MNLYLYGQYGMLLLAELESLLYNLLYAVVGRPITQIQEEGT